MQPVQIEEGAYTLPEPTYTPNTGYVFEGWLVKGLLKQVGDVITVTENTYLEAKWKDTNDYDAPHGFTKQPSDASEIAGIQIKYSVDNFTIDPSIPYEDVIAQLYDSESGEWTTAITNVSAGNGIVEAYGQKYIVFSSNIAGEFTFRLYARQGSTKVAISETFTVTWAAKQFTTQPQGDMVDVGDTVSVTADKNFYVEKYEIEYNDNGVWKLYQEISGGWDAFSFDFTSDVAKSASFRIKAYAEGDEYDEVNECWPVVLMDTSEEFTITWMSNEHVHNYGAIPNGKDETNHWKECTDPTCPDKQNSIIEVTPHKAIGGNCQVEAACACGNMLLGNHIISKEWTKVADGHYYTCLVNHCEHHSLLVPHTPDKSEPTKTESVNCSVCGYVITPALEDTPDNENDPSAPTPDIPNTNTDKPTDATESEKDDSTETEAPADKGCGGCASSAALSTLAIVAVVGSALVIKKKED